MFKPLDILAFDTDWPIDNGRVENLKDIRVIVKNVPTGMTVPCAVVVTAASGSSVTLALASRGTHVVNASTALTITKSSSGSLGKVYRGSNSYMTVDITAGASSFSYTGSLPLLVVPCCVMWLLPSYTPFSDQTLPNPGAGWTREIDDRTHRVIYRGNPPSAPSRSRTDDDSARLRSINGQSPEGISIVADGEGQIELEDQTITIKPGLRDVDDARRIL